MPGPRSVDQIPTESSGTHHLGLALVVISAAQLMIVLDATVTNVALPSIQRGLHFSTNNLQWLITAYSITFGGLLLFGGRSGDLYGKRRMFMVGISIFAVASLLGGLATDQAWIILTRGLQGVGGAIASPTALALIASNFPEGHPRSRAMGVYAAMSGGGGAVGLLLGGVFTTYISWRWVFFVNVPIAAIVLALAPRALRESPKTDTRLDVPGALTATAGIISLVYGLSNASIHSWTSLGTLVPLGLSVALLASFAVIETRAQAPLLPFRIFADRNRSGAYVIMLCIATAMFSMFFFLSQFLQNVLGYSPIKAGLAFLPMTGGIVFAAGLASRLVGKIRVPLLIGPAVAAIGLGLLSRLSIHTTYLEVVIPLILISLGVGFSFVPLTLTAVSGVRTDEAGLASALLNTSQQVGGGLGLAILATVSISVTKARAQQLASSSHGHLTHAMQNVALAHGYTTAFLAGACIALLALTVSALVIRVKDVPVPGHDPEIDPDFELAVVGG